MLLFYIQIKIGCGSIALCIKTILKIMIKKLFFFFSFLIAIWALLAHTAPQKTASHSRLIDRPLKERFESQIRQFRESLLSFKQKLSDSKSKPEEWLEAFKKSRLCYKRIELLGEYFDPYSSAQLNAPAIPKVEYEGGLATARPSQSMQVIEELVCDDEPAQHRQRLLELVEKSLRYEQEMGNVVQKYNFDDWMVFDALRQQLIRVCGLGIVGFDSPVLLHSVPEATVALEEMLETVRLYEPHLIDDREAFLQLRAYLTQAIKILRACASFEALDRVALIRNQLDPCWALLYQLQETLDIEPVEQRYAFHTAYDIESKSLFAPNFLKRGFFSQVKTKTLPAKVVDLGRMLFFDPVLSGNGERACASCHQPERAFAEAVRYSRSFNPAEHIGRNAPTLINSVFSHLFQTDGRASSIEEQFHQVLVNEREMNIQEHEAIRRIASSQQYQQLFSEAFGLQPNQTPDFALIRAALGAYVESLMALSSPVDRYMRRETNQLDAAAYRGFNLFLGKAKCATCHFIPLTSGSVPPSFKDSEVEVLGVPAEKDQPVIDPDAGRFHIANLDQHKHAFKTPTVRNAALSAPYMHNGVYDNLTEVMRFYNHGGGVGMGIPLDNQTLPADSLHLDEREIQDLVRFVEALTDTTGLTRRPQQLPALSGEHSRWNQRVVGGRY
jgi:cytochrome c peroxidase